MNAQTHPVSPETVMAYLDGELSSSEAASIGAHVESCADCSAVALKIRGASEVLVGWQVESMGAAVQERIIAATRRASSSAGSSRWLGQLRAFVSHPLPWAVTCALFAVLVGIETRRPAGKALDYAQAAVAPIPAGAGRDEPTMLRPSRVAAKIPALRLPMIARTVELHVTATKFDDVRSVLDMILVRYEGYAAELVASTREGNARSIHASLRIPAARLSAALPELKALGHVESETQQAEEVTEQHADLVARLKNSRETEGRLQSILVQRTGKISDVLEVEQEIARVRGEIEQMEAQQKSLERRVDFATVNLQLDEEYKAALGSAIPPTSVRLHNALVAGYRDAVESLIALLLFFAKSGPFLVLWLVILFLPARWIWRRWKSAYAQA